MNMLSKEDIRSASATDRVTDHAPPSKGAYNREKIINYRKNYPEMTLEAIGNEIGVSKQRVAQVLIEANIETRSLNKIPKELPLCKRCGKTVSTQRRIYCSNDCRYPEGKKVINCYYCKKEVILFNSQYKSRITKYTHLHCSRVCYFKSRKDKSIMRYNSTN